MTAAVYDDAAPATPTAPTAGVGMDHVLVLFDKDGATYDVYYLSSRRSLGYFGGVGKDPLWTVEALVDETRRGRRPHLTRDDAQGRLVEEVQLGRTN